MHSSSRYTVATRAERGACPAEVEMVCDRVAVIDRGRVVRQGSIAQLVRGALEVDVRVEGAPDRVLAEIERRWPRLTRTGGPPRRRAIWE